MSKIFRKSAYLALTLIFIFTLAGQSFASALKPAPLNPKFVEWYGGQATSGKTRSSGAGKLNYGYAPSPVNWSHLGGLVYNIGSSSSSRRADTLPASYDLRSKMTAVKNQNPFGNCWAHSAMAATESFLIGRGLVSSTDIDLSEWYLTYFAYNPSNSVGAFTNNSEKPYYDYGADDWTAVALLSRGTGSVLESQAPVPASSKDVYAPLRTNRTYKLTNAWYLGNLGVKEVHLNDQRRDMIKRAIKEYGAVSVGIHFNEKDYYNEVTYGYMTNGSPSYTNHAVTIVGWDDSYSKDNFKESCKPNDNGAWIVRNSWGDWWGEGGYFYVSYEEPTLCDGVVYVTEQAPQNERIYEYDPLGLVQFIGYSKYGVESGSGSGETAPVWYANLFTAKGNDTLTSVAFYTSAPEQECEIKVYTGCDGSPISGKLVLTQKTTVAAPGYNTVVLDSHVKLTRHEKFSVVICTSSDKTGFVVPCEYAQDNYSENAVSHEGESWLSYDGVKFEDIADATLDSLPNANVCIKAFATLPGTSISLIPQSLEIDAGSKMTILALVTPQGTVVTWESSDTSVCTVDANGIVTALKAGNAVVTASTADNFAQCFVTVTGSPTPPTPAPTGGSSSGCSAGFAALALLALVPIILKKRS